VCFHVITSTEDALANRAPGLACVQILVQCQRHRVPETLPTNSTAKQEAGVRCSAGLTVIVVRDELGDAAGRNGVGVVVVATRGGVSRGSLYKENNKHTTSPRIVSHECWRARVNSSFWIPNRGLIDSANVLHRQPIVFCSRKLGSNTYPLKNCLVDCRREKFHHHRDCLKDLKALGMVYV